ncbi:MAG: carboxypeptidase regulatory-like domain-containing protein [Nocardioidaceae bacterium]
MQNRSRKSTRTPVAIGAVLGLVLGLLLGLGMLPAAAQAAPRAAAAVPSSGKPAAQTNPKRPGYKPAACNRAVAAARKGAVPYARCFALGKTNSKGAVVVRQDGPPSTALGPAQIQDAYNLPGSGAGETVAVVDAFGYANAESDLAVFRSYYGLPACTTANGCFTKVDQRGGTQYPPEDPGWSIETALDLDAISSACPNCNLLLVEGDTNSLDDLGAAANTAATFNPVAISNSYGVPGEDPTELTYDHYYNHTGIAVTASTGDAGDVTNWPATNPNVVGVGGTTLTSDSSPRGWTETAWADGGSGCSPYEPRPDYQQDITTDCPNNKAIADISADADPATGLGIYNTSGESGWAQYGGTSLSSPLIAAMYALAGTPVPGTYPVTYPYNDPSRSADLNDVVSGTNGSCGNLLCEAGPGWDGPTGLGTPNGVSALTEGPHGDISGTVTDAGTSAPIQGANVTATDSSGNSFSATADSSGGYDVVAPAGTYDVTASMFGYVSKTISGVVIATDQTVTENFALAAAPSHTVSGTVTDDSGHGWPIYAKITIDGYPNGAVFTNPYTGHYSVSLPSGSTYAMHVAPVDMPGYLTSDESVTLGNANQTVNVGLKVDQTTCTAPGYSYHYNGQSTDFEGWTGSTPQDGWAVTDAAGSGFTWEFDDPGMRGNLTGGSGNFAIVDSDHWGPGTAEDTSLVSPVTDLSGQASPEIGFDTDYFSYINSVADVDLSLDGGQTWANVWEQTTSDAQGHVDVALPQAANQSQVEVRFHYTGQWAFYWELDNVFLGTRSCDATPGGLVAGNVRDGNNNQPINGAKVASDTHADEFGVTAPTPDDTAVPDGFYWLFSSDTGRTPFTATDGRYTPAHARVNVPADYVVHKNWKLAAGHLTVTPGAVSVTEQLGVSKSRSVTFGNDGTVPVHVKLGEQDGGFTPMAGTPATKGHGAPLIRAKGHFTMGAIKPTASQGPVATPGTVQLQPNTVQLNPGSARLNGATVPVKSRTVQLSQGPADPPWTSIADLPAPTMDNAVAYNDGEVYSVGGVAGTATTAAGYVYDPSVGSWASIADAPAALEKPSAEFVNGDLYLLGGWDASGNSVSTVYKYDPGADSWSQVADMPAQLTAPGTAVLDGQLYVVGGCTTGNCSPGSKKVFSYDPGTDSWTQHADYPMTDAWMACAGLSGQVVCAGGSSPDTQEEFASTYSYDPGSDSWTAGADMPYPDWAMVSAGSGGKLQVADGVSGGLTTNQASEYDPSTDSWAALPNANTALYRSGGSCGLYMIGGSSGGFTPVAESEVLPGYDQCAAGADVPWLSEDPGEFDVAPGQSVTVTVTMDASQVSQPGDYLGKVLVGTDSPYQVSPVTATMHVNPPRSWGKVRGTVVNAAGDPISGVTVQLCTMFNRVSGSCGPVTYTLKTDQSGYYQLWLSAGYSPLEVIAAKDGYQPALKLATIKKGATTTVNFTLNKS